MATHPFRETDKRIAADGLAARLVRNADPRTDPNGGNVHRLPVAPAPDRASGRESWPQPAEASGEPGEWLGRWAVLAMFGLTAVLAGAFLVLWLAVGPATSPRDTEETATAPPAPAATPPPSPAPLPPRPAISEPAVTPPAAAEPKQLLPAPAASPPAQPSAAAGLTLSPEERRALLARGQVLLDSGDVAAARPLLERAALAGDATAALRLGQSYDPGYLAEAGLRPAAGNLGLAIFWYRRGQELGNGTAAFLARKLETAARAGWGPISARPPAWRP